MFALARFRICCHVLVFGGLIAFRIMMIILFSFVVSLLSPPVDFPFFRVVRSNLFMFLGPGLFLIGVRFRSSIVFCGFARFCYALPFRCLVCIFLGLFLSGGAFGTVGFQCVIIVCFSSSPICLFCNSSIYGLALICFCSGVCCSALCSWIRTNLCFWGGLRWRYQVVFKYLACCWLPRHRGFFHLKVY